MNGIVSHPSTSKTIYVYFILQTITTIKHTHTQTHTTTTHCNSIQWLYLNEMKKREKKKQKNGKILKHTQF